NATVNLRPTTRLRVNATYVSSSYRRRDVDVESFSMRIPRLKVEYQVSRPIFIRIVSQYQSTHRLALTEQGVDPRSGVPLFVRQPDGSYAQSRESTSNALRADWLFSYRPSPGT